jgi:uncharacterized LabA/DUF88 family protein
LTATIYHSIKRLSDKDIKFKDCKWLNLQALCSRYIDPKNEELTSIKYFTALSWKSAARIKQQICINALLYQCGTNIDIIYGKFKQKQKWCSLCKQNFISHEEKLTDVNIAIYMFENALKNNFDEAVIISADSDLIPAINRVKAIFPDKTISLLPPCGNPAVDLISVSPKKNRMRESALLDSKLPAICGIFKMPEEWQSKNYFFDAQTKQYIFNGRPTT